jgi:uroporphyrinogen decarboxylase
MSATMTSKQRLLATIHHQEPDRVPITPRIWAYLTEYYGDYGIDYELRAAEEFGYDPMLPGLQAAPTFAAAALTYRHVPPTVHVTQAVDELDGAVTVRRRFETPAGPLSDVIFMPPSGREYGINVSPVQREYMIKEPADLERLAYVLPRVSKATITRYHELSRTVGERGIVEMTVNAPLDYVLGDLRGSTQLMIDYYEDRPFFDRMFAFFQEYALQQLHDVLEGGVRYIFGTWFYASLSAGWGIPIFREVFTPLIKQHADLVHRYGGVYHIYDDGKMMESLPEYVGAGADIVETLTPPPVGDVDLAAAKRLYGARTCLKGYIDLLYVIKEGTPALIDEAVRQAIEIAAPGGGFILGSSDSIRDGTPNENVRAYFDAAHKYGVYR